MQEREREQEKSTVRTLHLFEDTEWTQRRSILTGGASSKCQRTKVWNKLSESAPCLAQRLVDIHEGVLKQA